MKKDNLNPLWSNSVIHGLCGTMLVLLSLVAVNEWEKRKIHCEAQFAWFNPQRPITFE
jgi:hypothetical protein